MCCGRKDERSLVSAYCLNELGNIATALGDYAEAKQHYQTSYAIRESFEDPEGMALALNHLGKIAALQARYEEAAGLYRQSLALYRQINDRGGLATSLNGLGTNACALGNYAVAQGHLRQALQIAMDVQFVPLMLSVLISFGKLLLSIGQQEPGIELLAFVREHPASERETRNRAQECLDRHKAKLEPEFIEKARNRDLEMVASAVLQGELMAPDTGTWFTPPESDQQAHPAEQPLVEPLTPRELEVLRLIADGLSNQEIADNLIISVGTVKFYTSQIYGKLNVGSRTQAVARARQLGMLP